MAKGEALGHKVNMEPRYRHQILCTHIYLLQQSTETGNVHRNFTAPSNQSENKLDSSIRHPAIYITHIGVIYREETTTT